MSATTRIVLSEALPLVYSVRMLADLASASCTSLPPKVLAEDPLILLIQACGEIAGSSSDGGRDVWSFISPLFVAFGAAFVVPVWQKMRERRAVLSSFVQSVSTCGHKIGRCSVGHPTPYPDAPVQGKPVEGHTSPEWSDAILYFDTDFRPVVKEVIGLNKSWVDRRGRRVALMAVQVAMERFRNSVLYGYRKVDGFLVPLRFDERADLLSGDPDIRRLEFDSPDYNAIWKAVREATDNWGEVTRPYSYLIERVLFGPVKEHQEIPPIKAPTVSGLADENPSAPHQ
jgi:hypothetical protein